MLLRVDDDASVRGPGLDEILALPVGKDVHLHPVRLDAFHVAGVGGVDAVAPDLLARLAGRASHPLDAGVLRVSPLGAPFFEEGYGPGWLASCQ